MGLSRALLMYIVYVWSRREPEAPISFFGFKVKGFYVPWIFLAFDLLIGAPLSQGLIGITVGHAYYFLIDVFPISHGVDIIRTPRFCISAVEYMTGFTQPVAPHSGQPRAAAAA